MALTVYEGRRVYIWLDLNRVGGAGANWVKIGQQKGGSLSRSAETADATNKDNYGAPTAIVTRMPWNFSCDGALNPADPAIAEMTTVWKTGVETYVKWDESAISGEVVSGPVLITKFSKDAPMGDLVSYSVEFQGNGQLAAV